MIWGFEKVSIQTAGVDLLRNFVPLFSTNLLISNSVLTIDVR
jgi:hypothetical protein